MNRIKKIYITIFFSILFFIGLYIYRDYGVPGDEAYHQWAASYYYSHIKNLLINFNFNNEYYVSISNYLQDEYLRLWFIYPIFFDVINELAVDIFNIKKINKIFEIRHLTNFLFFFLSTIFFFKLIFKRFENFNYGLLAVVLVFFSPRIFVESFYNSKDILFLSLTIINLYYIFEFFENKNLKNLILFSVSSGLLINTRIMGLIIFAIVCSIVLFDSIDIKKELYENTKKILLSVFICFFVVFIFWPYIWSDPLNNILSYFNFLKSGGNIVVTNLYFGEIINSNNTPWHYLLSWIAISIPLTSLILSLIGLTIILTQFSKRLLNLEKTNILWKNNLERNDFTILIIFLSVLLASFLYEHNWDGWRHYYFIYPLMIYFSICGLNSLSEYNLNLFKIVIFVTLVNYSYTIYWIFKNHPHQYVYFNSIKKNMINKKFDLDWWGMSLKNSLSYILNNDNNNKIKISSIGEVDLSSSIKIFEINKANKFIVTNIEQADYVLEVFRPKIDIENTSALKNFNKYYELKIDNNLINIVYKRND